MAAISILGAGGYPKSPYGSFAGKPSASGKGLVSVLGPQGVPRPPYGSFAGKSGGAVTDIHFQPFINNFISRMWSR